MTFCDFPELLHRPPPSPIVSLVKTKVVDAPTDVLDEDEEKARVVSTAGVDAEDANVSVFTVFRRCGRRCWGRLRGPL